MEETQNAIFQKPENKTKAGYLFYRAGSGHRSCGAVCIYTMNTINTQSETCITITWSRLASIQSAMEDIRANQLIAVYEHNPGTLQTEAGCH